MALTGEGYATPWAFFLLCSNVTPSMSPAEATRRRIADELDRLDPNYARYLASFAFILSRVANADRQVSADDVAAMEALVNSKGGVSRVGGGSSALARRLTSITKPEMPGFLG